MGKRTAHKGRCNKIYTTRCSTSQSKPADLPATVVREHVEEVVEQHVKEVVTAVDPVVQSDDNMDVSQESTGSSPRVSSLPTENIAESSTELNTDCKVQNTLRVDYKEMDISNDDSLDNKDYKRHIIHFKINLPYGMRCLPHPSTCSLLYL